VVITYDMWAKYGEAEWRKGLVNVTPEFRIEKAEWRKCLCKCYTDEFRIEKRIKENAYLNVTYIGSVLRSRLKKMFMQMLHKTHRWVWYGEADWKKTFM
jgi:hypothetical protein